MTVNDSHDPTVLPPVTQPLFSIQEEATEPVWTSIPSPGIKFNIVQLVT